MGTSGKAREPRPEGYTGEPRGDSGRGLNHILPTASQCPGFGKELGASHLLLLGRVSVGGVCAGGTPAPAGCLGQWREVPGDGGHSGPWAG